MIVLILAPSIPGLGIDTNHVIYILCQGCGNAAATASNVKPHALSDMSIDICRQFYGA